MVLCSWIFHQTLYTTWKPTRTTGTGYAVGVLMGDKVCATFLDLLNYHPRLLCLMWLNLLYYYRLVNELDFFRQLRMRLLQPSRVSEIDVSNKGGLSLRSSEETMIPGKK